MAEALDHIERERFSPLGDTPLVVLDARDDAARYRDTAAVVIGVDRDGATPALDGDTYDVLVTTAAHAPRPWISVTPASLEGKLEAFAGAVRAAPMAASVLRHVLRMTDKMAFNDALTVESLAYSTLLGGAEFRAWRTANPAQGAAGGGSVRYERTGNHVTLSLSSAETRNAMTAAMRDALCEALAAVLDDPSMPAVTLRAEGACFSVGGALAEFGSNPDLAQAHAIRTTRSVARLLHALGARAAVRFHGACIGSGFEGPAAAARRTAVEGSFFQLPELKFGLIPGAGGTVTLPRAIGRHRACAMMLGGARVSCATALDWGLVHDVAPRT